MKQEELELNFETGKILRGNKELMTLEELLFLLDSAVQSNNLCPNEQSESFVFELRESIGAGFTKEQFQEIKEMMKTEMNE